MTNTFENCYLDGDIGYFFSYEMNGLFQIDMKKQEYRFLRSVETDGLRCKRLFGGIALVKDKIILAPMAAPRIVVIDLEDQTEHLVDIPKIDLEYPKEECKFYTVIPYGDYAYLVGHCFPAILKLNVETYAIKVISSWSFGLVDQIKKGCDLFRNNFCIREDKILVACCQKNSILELDMETDTASFIEVGSAQRRYSGIAYGGGYYWLCSFLDHSVVKWKYGTDEWTEFDFYDHNDSDQYYNMRYSQGFCIGRYIVILPLYVYSTCIVNIEDDEISLVDTGWILQGQEVPVAALRGGFIYNGDLYVSCSIDGYIYRLDIENKRYIKENIRTSALKNIYNGKIDTPKIGLDRLTYESPEGDIGTMLDFICPVEEGRIDKKRRGNIGSHIYRDLRRQI